VANEWVIGLPFLIALLGRKKQTRSPNSPQTQEGIDAETTADYVYAQKEFIRIVGDVNDSEPDFFLHAADATWSNDYKDHQLIRQLWEPASRIRLIDLTQWDIDRAEAFIAGAWKSGLAAGCQPDTVERHIQNVNEEHEVGAKVLDAFASLLEVVVGIVAPGASSALDSFSKVGGLKAGATELRRQEFDFSKVLPTVLDDLPRTLGAFSRWQRIGTYAQETADGNLIQFWDESGGDFPTGIPLQNVMVANTDRPREHEYANGEGTEFLGAVNQVLGRYIRGGLFRRNPSVSLWLYPWNSVELGGKAPLRTRVYLRARMYRALDFMATQILAEVDSRLYDYLTDSGLLIHGSVFPPANADTVAPQQSIATREMVLTQEAKQETTAGESDGLSEGTAIAIEQAQRFSDALDAQEAKNQEVLYSHTGEGVYTGLTPYTEALAPVEPVSVAPEATKAETSLVTGKTAKNYVW
jgi:hypothetical protein